MQHAPLAESIVKLLGAHDNNGLSRERRDPETNMGAVEFYNYVSEFAERTVRPLDDIAHAQDRFPHELWGQLGEAGLKGLIIPKEHGGMGFGGLELGLSTFEIAKASPAIAVSYVCDQALPSYVITKNGTDEQKRAYLPKLASGEHVGALAMSEPDAGSDVLGRMQTRARKVDGGFIVNGEKCWITNGARFDPKLDERVTADTLVLYAKTNDTDKVTAFIVEGGSDGFLPEAVLKKAVAKGSDTSVLRFDDLFIPDENVIGEVGKGARILMSGLNFERLVFAAGTLGAAVGAFEEIVPYLCDRKTFGKPVAFNADVAQRDLANMYSKIRLSQKDIITGAIAFDQDPKSLSNEEAASILLEAGNTADDVTNKCQQLYGGVGLLEESRIVRQVGKTRLMQIGAGTKQMREMIVARAIIPGYAEAQKREMDLRALGDAFADATGISRDQFDPADLARKLQTGTLKIVNDNETSQQDEMQAVM